MTKPEITKKTSTPTNPPLRPGTPAWKRTTRSTAIDRRPSTSGRNLRSAGGLPDSSSRSTGRPSMPEAPEGRVSRTSARYLLMAPRVEAVEKCTLDRRQPVDQREGSRVGRPTFSTEQQARQHRDSICSAAAIPAGHRSAEVRQIPLHLASYRPLATTAYRSLRRRRSRLPLRCNRDWQAWKARPGRWSDRPRPCGGRLTRRGRIAQPGRIVVGSPDSAAGAGARLGVPTRRPWQQFDGNTTDRGFEGGPHDDCVNVAACRLRERTEPGRTTPNARGQPPRRSRAKVGRNRATGIANRAYPDRPGWPR